MVDKQAGVLHWTHTRSDVTRRVDQTTAKRVTIPLPRRVAHLKSQPLSSGLHPSWFPWGAVYNSNSNSNNTGVSQICIYV